jgi:hypothetical protein
MPTKLKSYALHYIEGVAASAANGGIAALAAIVGPAVVNATGIAHVLTLTPHQLAATFAGGAALSAFDYFRKHPFPVDEPDPAPGPATPA